MSNESKIHKADRALEPQALVDVQRYRAEIAALRASAANQEQAWKAGQIQEAAQEIVSDDAGEV